MDKIIVAVGGGEIGRMQLLPDGSAHQTDVETTKIDCFIVEASGKKHPQLLFIGTASGDKEAYLEVIREHFADRLGCAAVTPLNLLNTTLSADEIRQKILAADIIYVGGGIGIATSAALISGLAASGTAGAAATTSGLAALGGGSIAAGGAGMAGGIAVASAITATTAVAANNTTKEEDSKSPEDKTENEDSDKIS